ncbi:hypothetical protein BT93_K0206 [Corymbia citriodora subsp. variegata]|nr:hypothetical protein BT93_K0206 [Corymbia citriodora subsp. variegata]
MDAIKVEIKSKATIGPSSPIPQRLRSLKLSLLDQLSSRVFRENQFVECNDCGAKFIEAEANCPLSEILRLLKVELLDQLLPFDYHIARLPTKFQIAVQANVFTCGGLAIGWCTLHKLIDGVTFTSLVNTWAAKSRGSGDHLSSAFVGLQLFPQKDLSEKITSHSCGDRPSCNEVVSALIWKCAMDASRARSGSSVSSVLIQTVNLRARINPSLSEFCAGNLFWLAMASGSDQIGLHDLVSEIRKSIKKFDWEHVRKMQGKSGFSLIFESLKQIVELASANVDIYRFTSLGKFQLYEADFSWGKLVWVSSTRLIFKNVVVLIELRFGDGIDAWVTMEEKDLGVFERNQELLAFASATESPSCLLLNSLALSSSL